YWPLWDLVLYDAARRQPNLTLLLNCSCTDAATEGHHLVSVTGWQLTTQTWQTVNAKIFGDQEFKYGAFTSTDARIRQKAVDLARKSADMAREMDANISSLWPGQDGFDYYFQNDYYRQWDRTVSALREICGYAPDLRFAYEYKPREPRMYSLVSNAAKAVLLVQEVGADNLGVTLDYGHALFARENAAESLCLIDRAGKLFNVHFNDAYGDWDDDLIAGSVNIWSTLEFLWYLKRTEYNGYVTLDMFPYREDPYEACALAVRMIKTLEEIAGSLDGEQIRGFQESNDAAGVMEMLRRKVLLQE
ncbi:MAG: TIM barrel protein, partial [Spirochaetota bacterium]